MSGHPDEERLNDWVDGLLAPAAAGEAEAHLAECPVCDDAVVRLRALQALTAELPRSIEPPEGTWDAIAARTVDLGRTRREVLRGLRLPLAIAATVLVAVSAGATALFLRAEAESAADPAVASTPASMPATASAAQVLVAEDSYQREYERLIAEFRARRDVLDPATVAVVEENLRIVEGALETARGALAADPSNRDLPLLITSTHRQRIQLVERALRLATAPERSEA